MYKAVILSANHSFPVTLNNGEAYLDDKPLEVDIKRLNGNTFHVLINQKSYLAEIVDTDYSEKKCIIRINGTHYKMLVQDPYSELLTKLGIDSKNIAKVSELKAPMPGLVLAISVKEGDILMKDDNLITLEAMKMENIIKCPGDATVKSILVKLGDKVEKNQVLIRF